MAEPYNMCNDLTNKQREYVSRNEQLLVAFNNAAIRRKVNYLCAKKNCIHVRKKWSNNKSSILAERALFFSNQYL